MGVPPTCNFIYSFTGFFVLDLYNPSSFTPEFGIVGISHVLSRQIIFTGYKVYFERYNIYWLYCFRIVKT